MGKKGKKGRKIRNLDKDDPFGIFDNEVNKEEDPRELMEEYLQLQLIG